MMKTSEIGAVTECGVRKNTFVIGRKIFLCVCVYFNVVTVLYIIVSLCFYFEERVTEIEGRNKRWT